MVLGYLGILREQVKVAQQLGVQPGVATDALKYKQIFVFISIH
jgi:hypothetical protein